MAKSTTASRHRVAGFVYPSGAIVQPFGDPAAESRILNETLAEQRERLFRRLGMRLTAIGSPAEARGDDFLLLPDNLYLTAPVVLDFLRASGDAATPVERLAMARSLYVDRTAVVSDELEERTVDGCDAVVYPLYRVRGGAPPSAETLAGATPRLVTGKTHALSFDGLVPTPGRPELPRFPLSFHQVVLIESWVHIWAANAFGLPIVWARAFTEPWHALTLIVRLLWGVLTYLPAEALALVTGRPTNLGPQAFARHVLSQLVIRGRGTRIDPSARVIASRLGRNVVIGPNAVVAFSVVGDGAKVDSCGEVVNSVVGERSHLVHRPEFNMSTCYPDARAQLLQVSLVGRRATVGAEVRAYDLKLTGNVKVEHRGRMRDTGTIALALCVGHEASVWGRVSFAPGRAVPNHAFVVENPDQVAHRFSPDLEPDGLAVIRGGTVEPA